LYGTTHECCQRKVCTSSMVTIKKYDVIAALSLVVGTLITTCMSIILGHLEYGQSNLVSYSWFVGL
jgi:hypothetical protein